MDHRTGTEGLFEATQGFALKGTLKDCVPYGNGHINDTFLITYQQNRQDVTYILQRMNKKFLPARRS